MNVYGVYHVVHVMCVVPCEQGVGCFLVNRVWGVLDRA